MRMTVPTMPKQNKRTGEKTKRCLFWRRAEDRSLNDSILLNLLKANTFNKFKIVLHMFKIQGYEDPHLL